MKNEKLKLFFDNVRPSILQLGLPGPLAYENGQSDLIRFDDNISDIGNNWSQYPNPILTKQKENYIAFLSELEKNKGVLDLKVSSENLIFTTGAVDGLDLLLKCLIHNSNTDVHLAVPTFSGFHHWLKIYGARANFIKLRGRNKNRIFLKDINSKKSNLLLLCNPNNPLGSQISINNILSILNNFEGIVIIDEAYMDFSNLPSCLYLLNQYPNLIILRTCSKSLGLAGLRIGAIFAHKDIINLLIKIQPVYNMPSPVISAFDYALRKNNVEEILIQINQINTIKSILMNSLRKNNHVERIYHSETNFITVLFKGAEKIKKYLEDNNIALYWINNGEELIARITICLKYKNDLLINLLEKLK